MVQPESQQLSSSGSLPPKQRLGCNWVACLVGLAWGGSRRGGGIATTLREGGLPLHLVAPYSTMLDQPAAHMESGASMPHLLNASRHRHEAHL